MVGRTKSSTMAQDILDMLPKRPPGVSYKEIHSQVGKWKIDSIEETMRLLLVEGSVVKAGKRNKATFYRALMSET
jgi:hypothetical protein